MRGLVLTMAEGRQTGLLFTSMSLLESIGLLVSGPLLAESLLYICNLELELLPLSTSLKCRVY